MNTAQAAALMQALAGEAVPADAQMRYNGGTTQVWSVSIPAGTVLTGLQVAELNGYCVANSLSLSFVFSSMVVV